jgi:hypothetical protein
VGDVARRFTLLGIVEKPLRMVRQRDSQQCHTSRATPVTPVTRAGPRPSSQGGMAVTLPLISPSRSRPFGSAPLFAGAAQQFLI